MTIVEAVVTFVWGVLVISAAIYMAAQNIRLRVRLYRMENEVKRTDAAVEAAKEAIDRADRRLNDIRNPLSGRTLSGQFPDRVRTKNFPLDQSKRDIWDDLIDDESEDTKP